MLYKYVHVYYSTCTMLYGCHDVAIFNYIPSLSSMMIFCICVCISQLNLINKLEAIAWTLFSNTGTEKPEFIELILGNILTNTHKLFY